MSEPESQASEPVPLQFCEAKPLVDDLRTLKGLSICRETYDHTSRPIIGMMTRGYRYWPRCDNTDRHGLCLGHPAEGGGA